MNILPEIRELLVECAAVSAALGKDMLLCSLLPL